ncbi:ATP-binding cassette domain-containing protein [Rufibacter quisquiliarum]|uniref:ABC-type multidrug transport system fused ATPase/permease subunit n=1 Tax=Rufibacter quisquiliarum TaxID=1549639 RepID=A0A839GGG0_9BACT|nr:ABC transporter ATP-binding protein [Rufibacter quisquiliarum]MBA9076673.1 ABC-type multidrug transport system fused ATPase/permease subunit [Rufibacter quisquiliarum]
MAIAVSSLLGLKEKVALVLNAAPKVLKPKFYLSTLYVILIPLLDLAVAFWMYALLMVLQGEAVHVLGTTLRAGEISWVIGAFVMITVVRQGVEYLSIRVSRTLSQEIFQSFSIRLLEKYLSLPWLQYTQENKAVRVKHCTVTALDGAYSFQVVLNLIGAAISLLVLGIAALVKMPVVALSGAGLLALFSVISKKLIKSKLQEAVTDHDTYQRRFYQRMHESLSLPREINVFGAKDYFQGAVFAELKRLNHAKIDMSVLPHIPRIVLEAILTLVLAATLLIVTWVETYSSGELIANLATIVVLARRIIPAMAAFLSAFSELDGSVFNIEVIEKELAQKGRPETYLQGSNSLNAEELLQLRQISFQYTAGQPVLQDVSLSICQGDRIALLGETGRGKSTLLMISAGLIEPTAGEVIISSTGGHTPKRAYVPQEVVLLSGSVLENISFGEAAIDEAWAWQVLEAVMLKELVSQLPQGILSPIGDNGVMFSGGQRQRLGIARALYKRPDLLFLDEATSALDEETEQVVMANINTCLQKGAVLFITHRKSTAELFATYTVHLT